MSADRPGRLSHLDDSGQARMVDISAKEVSAREAAAVGFVELSPEAVRAVRTDAVGKGDVLAVARIAGIQAAKRTSELIPLCHPLALSSVTVELSVDDAGVAIRAVVRTTDRTGVEMEALTAVSVAALTVIDMIKAVDKAAVVRDIQVVAKSGGRSGDWQREPR